MKKVVTLFLVLIISAKMQAQKQSIVPIIPLPLKMEMGKGFFEISEATNLIAQSKECLSDLQYFKNYLSLKYDLNLKLSVSDKKKKSVFVKQNVLLKPDAYKLEIDSNGVRIEGGDGAGVFYGLQTLIQLLPAGKTNKLNVAILSIQDEPRFSWRGMHLDVCRHFFGVDEVKKYLDYLALYKLNTFHWHLTDDQGWRIEINNYPRLTSVAAYRNGTLIGHYGEKPERYDTLRYGGFYTQDQIREVVAYAMERHITIVPEIELPGHALAALAAYPMLACTKGPFEVGKTWGVFKDVYCPSVETFNFLEDVLNQVCELFPGKYIHIGGDECPKDRWKESEYCQALMKKEGLKDEHELQSFFVNRIGKFLQSKGKKMIGWDEILEGGIPEDATIMSWRGYAGGIEAAKLHHDVVMTPTSYCYFDYYQSRNNSEPLAIGGYLPLNMVYRFEPIADVMTKEDAAYVLGTQGNLWTEYIDNWKKVEYMTMPRMAALSEVAWTSKEQKDYGNFVSRLSSHTKLLSFLGINYSKSFYDISSHITPAGNQGINIELISSYPNAEIRYSVDGRSPNNTSPIFKNKILADQTFRLKAAIFDGPQIRGEVTEQQYFINLATGKEITLANQPNPEYATGGSFSLVNSQKGSLPWNGSDWLGFTGNGLDATIDLGMAKQISTVSIDILNDSDSWIYPPASLEVLVSDNNIDFKSVGKLTGEKIKTVGRKVSLLFDKTNARFVKVVAPTIGKIPALSPGSGNESWLMVDEIEIF